MENDDPLKILSITSVFPFPPDNGTKIPIYHRLRRLSQRNEITMLCVHSDDVEQAHIDEMTKYCAIHLINAPLPREARGPWAACCNFLRSLWNRAPYFMLDNTSWEAELWLGRKIAQGCFDIIEAGCGDVAMYLPRGLRPLNILILHSLMDASLKRQMAIERNLLKKFKTFAYWLVWRGYEKRIYTNADLCVTLTKQMERECLGLNPGIPAINCLTNGVDLDYFSFHASKEKPTGVCFVGRMDYPPNVDAVIYFYQEILPLIRGVHDNIKFYIVGSSPPREVRHLARDKGVEVTGYVKDIRPYLRKAGIAVVPTRTGSGILNKILEPLALGVPVITRSMSVEGLSVKPGKDLLIADSPGDFAQCIIRLLDDAFLRHKLAHNGRKYVENNHRWDKIIDQYEWELRNQLRKY